MPDAVSLIAAVSIVTAGFSIGIAAIGNAIGQGRAVADAVQAIAQQPDASNNISRTLFVGLAMVESSAIYTFVIALILIFANPFWNYLTSLVTP
ncbi:MAG TPA: F0F1 ATP synthase subunit C [Limnochordales bacterium]|nr:F0F1 ATP synthase subunit C [Limnochordales bacterium]